MAQSSSVLGEEFIITMILFHGYFRPRASNGFIGDASLFLAKVQRHARAGARDVELASGNRRDVGIGSKKGVEWDLGK